jgi:hypothetical protein
MPGAMRLTFLVSLLAMGLLFTTLWKLELTAKNLARELRRLRRSVDRGLGPEPAPAAPARQASTTGAAVAASARAARGS